MGPWVSQSCTIHQEWHFSSDVQWVKLRSLGICNHIPLVWSTFCTMVSRRKQSFWPKCTNIHLSPTSFHLPTICFHVLMPEISIFIFIKWLSLHMTFYFKLQCKNVETVYVAAVLSLFLVFIHLNVFFHTLPLVRLIYASLLSISQSLICYHRHTIQHRVKGSCG